ncbi:hypothetical protein ACLK2A_01825 [Escherichia coli]
MVREPGIGVAVPRRGIAAMAMGVEIAVGKTQLGEGVYRIGFTVRGHHSVGS